MKNAPNAIIALLEEGIQATRMKSAKFGPLSSEGDRLTEKIIDETKIYRETWVEQPLLVALAYLKGEIDAAQADRLWLVGSRRVDEDIRDPRIALGIEGQ
jgi:hypothetical protein